MQFLIMPQVGVYMSGCTFDCWRFGKCQKQR